MRSHSEAVQDLEKSIGNMLQHEDRVGAASANYMLGTCLIQIGELERASARLSEAVSFYRQSRMHPFLARALAALAALRDRQGQPVEARELRTEAQFIRTSAGGG